MASVRPSHFFLWLCLLPLPFYYSDAEAKCTPCKVALGNYYVNQNYNITYISSLFDNEINYETLKNWNSDSFNNPNYIQWGITIRIPFPCDCLGEDNNRYLGHMFHYNLAGGDTYEKIANTIYANLTTVSALQNVNSYPANSIPDGATLNVSINCSCGDASISKAYGLFLTYPLNATIDNLAVLTKTYTVSADLLKKYNPTVDFTDASGIAFVPNQDTVTNPNFLLAGSTIRIPFSCDCLGEGNNRYLGHMFHYNAAGGDTYDKIANTIYANLTTASALQNVNSYTATSIPPGATLNVSINCSCGDASINKAYGLFLTYPLNATIDNLAVLTKTYSVSADLLQKYNPTVDFTDASGIAFVPNQDPTGSYLPLNPSGGGIGPGTIAGISIGIAFALLLIAFGMFYIYVYKHKKAKKSALLHMTGAMSTESVALAGNTTQGFTDITVDKSVEFTYQELAEATSDFSIANKIGEGGFGAVYYAELHGEKAAIKKMDMQATKEFLAELNVLTHVHHLNLVRLIGFCIEECLFLVYEFIENGNLSQHLHGSGMEPLSWPARVQIALDSARGLEYIHEHTVPVYIHRDIKSANILIDRNFRAKVADFGLTKLTEVGGASAAFPTRLVGTFGYMPPEYAQFGEVSPKVDVYAFGVVLYEIISAKEAIVRIDDVSAESKGLVTLFESILKDPNGRESLRSLIDPRLGNNYMLDSVWKMAQLARACTQENPQLRPSMRTVVVALMTLSSSTEDWDVGSFYENQAIVNLMGR